MESWQIRDIVQRALQEDLPFGDKTTEYLIPQNLQGRAFFLAKEDLILCGRPVAEAVFQEVDDTLKTTWHFEEGAKVPKGTKFGYVEGRVASLLKGERVALNFLQHLSGIATKVRRMVEVLSGTSTLLLDTRKTLPGMKILQKYAVRVGGGVNHRFSLSDGILVKDNHIKALGGLKALLEKLKGLPHYLKVEVEIKNLEELNLILRERAKVDCLLLDNFSPEEIKKAIKLIRESRPSLLVEISGGIREDNLADFGKLGVDFISSGALTHSVKAVDISFKIEETWI